MVSINCSNWRAGLISHSKCASSSPAFQNLWCPTGDGDPLARPGEDSRPVELEADRATQDVEALLLVGVQVLRGDEAGRLDERLDRDKLTVRLLRGLEEHETLAGHVVLDGISLADQ